MFKIAFIARSTLFTVPGGDTVQVVQTAAHLRNEGIIVDILLCNEPLNYKEYDLLHFFNIGRPSDIIYHIQRSNKPFVVSTILVDYSEYDKYYRKGISGGLFNFLSPDAIEYLKTIARWLKGKDGYLSSTYIWKGQKKSILEVLKRAALLLPNSWSEYNRIWIRYHCFPKYSIIPNGIDTKLFVQKEEIVKNKHLVICVARIEGIKNQLNLIKALNNTSYTLLLIGGYAPNQKAYYKECKRIAAANVKFMGHLPQSDLLPYYQSAKVHVLPSWFETTGLSSLEAAAMGCQVVITAKGDAKEYFDDQAFYCDPALPESIYNAIENAAQKENNEPLRQKILEKFTWQQATLHTLSAYKQVIEHRKTS